MREQRVWAKRVGVIFQRLRCHQCGREFRGRRYGPQGWNVDHYCPACKDWMNSVDGVEYSLRVEMDFD